MHMNLLMLAAQNWGDFFANKDKSIFSESFIDFIKTSIGRRRQPNYEVITWLDASNIRLSDYATQRVEMLTSPHWRALLKAYQIKKGE